MHHQQKPVQDPGSQESQRLSAEDLFLILVFFFCAIAGIGLALWKDNSLPAVSACFLATAVATLVYRFLGGLGDGSGVSTGDGRFSPLKIKLTGSIAALMGSYLLIFGAMTDFRLLTDLLGGDGPQAADEPERRAEFDPSEEQWVALNSQARPIKISINPQVALENPCFIGWPLSSRGWLTIPWFLQDSPEVVSTALKKMNWVRLFWNSDDRRPGAGHPQRRLEPFHQRDRSPEGGMR